MNFSMLFMLVCVCVLLLRPLRKLPSWRLCMFYIANTSPIQIVVPIQMSLTFWLNGLLTLSYHPPPTYHIHTHTHIYIANTARQSKQTKVKKTTNNKRYCRWSIDKQSLCLDAGSVKYHRDQHHHCHHNHHRRQASIHGSSEWPLCRLALCVAIYHQLHGIIVVTSLSVSSSSPSSPPAFSSEWNVLNVRIPF